MKSDEILAHWLAHIEKQCPPDGCGWPYTDDRSECVSCWINWARKKAAESEEK